MDTQAQGEFELMEGATSDVMARFVELVKAGFNPKGQPIIEKLWGIKAGGSSAYKLARDLRDQLANRLNEFEGFNQDEN